MRKITFPETKEENPKSCFKNFLSKNDFITCKNCSLTVHHRCHKREKFGRKNKWAEKPFIQSISIIDGRGGTKREIRFSIFEIGKNFCFLPSCSLLIFLEFPSFILVLGKFKNGTISSFTLWKGWVVWGKSICFLNS